MPSAGDVVVKSQPGWRGAVLGRAAFVVLVVLVLRRTFDVPLFFDEIWRVDYLTTRHLFEHYFKQNTPIAIGWVLLHRALMAVLPNREVTFRIIALAWYLLFLECVWRVLRSAREQVPISATVALALLALLPGNIGFVEVFYNYSFEMAYAALLLWLVRPAVPSSRADASALALLAVSGLFVTPAPLIAPWLYLELWRRTLLRRRWVVLSGALFLVGCAVQYLVFVRPVVDRALSDAWQAQRVSFDVAHLRDLGALLVAQLRYTMLIDTVADGWLGALGASAIQALFGASVVIGCVILFFVARRILFFGAIAVVLSAGLSFATGWPFGPVRTNACFWWTVSYAILLAWVTPVVALLTKLRVPPAAGAALALLLLCPWKAFARPPFWDEPFGRGLERDVRVIARSPVKKNLVLSYHFMSWYYPEYFLNSRYRSDREFKIVRDVRDDDRLYAHVDEVVSQEIGDRDAVWCLIPYDSGPEASDQACRLHLPGFRRIHDSHGHRARVIGFLRER